MPGPPWHYAVSVSLAYCQSELVSAQGLAADATRMALAMGKGLQIVRCVELFARIGCALGWLELSAQLYGAAEAARQKLGYVPPRPALRASLQADLALLGAGLGPTAMEDEFSIGRGLSIHEAAALALHLDVGMAPPAFGHGSVGSDLEVASSPPDWRICLLGRISVEAKGTPIEVPGRMPSQLLKVVALLGPIQVDEIVEVLWAEAAPGVGRRRLNNVITRLRQACGEVVVRKGETLALAPGVEVDVRIFEDGARFALAASRSGKESAALLCRDAIAVYQGELLPTDRYEDWAVGPRVHLLGLHLELLDALAASALADSRPDEAVEWLEQAIEAEPLDEYRYRRAGALMTDLGWHNRARSLAQRARRMTEDLGVALADELAALLVDIPG